MGAVFHVLGDNLQLSAHRRTKLEIPEPLVHPTLSE